LKKSSFLFNQWNKKWTKCIEIIIEILFYWNLSINWWQFISR